MSKLKDIFEEHYKEILYILHPRKSVIENVNKMIDCGDSSKGDTFLGCPECGELPSTTSRKNIFSNIYPMKSLSF